MNLANAPLGVLILAVGALAVIGLHSLKPLRKKLPVSSTFLWTEQDVPATGAIPFQRPRASRLLSLQLLMVGIIAFLFAQPVGRSVSDLQGHTVVVVDVSASMGSTSSSAGSGDDAADRLSEARVAVREIVDELADSGVVSLISAGPTPQVLVNASTDRARFLDAVDGLQLSDGSADIDRAMNLAVGLDRPDAPIGIVLVSDGIHQDFTAGTLPVDFTHRQVGDASTNYALTDLAAESTPAGLVVIAESQAFAGGSVDTTISFDVDGRTEAVLDVRIDSSEASVTQVILPAGSNVEARLDVDDDLAVDNARYATTRTQGDLVVSISGPTTPFLDSLLTAVPGVRLAADGEQPDAIVFSGGVVPEDVDRPYLAIAPEGGAPGIAVSETIEEPEISFVQSSDRLLTGLDLSNLRVRAAQLVDAPSAEVLIGSEEGPLMVRQDNDGVRSLYLTFALTDSSLPVDAAFPVLGQRIMEELSAAVRVPVRLTVGDPIVAPANQLVVVTAPDGTERELTSGSEVVTPDRAGMWTIASEGDAVLPIAVNADLKESVLEPQFLRDQARSTAAGGSISPIIDRPFAWPFLIGLFVLAVLEFVESRRRKAVPKKQWVASTLLRVAAGVFFALSIVGWVVDGPTNDVATVFVLDRSDSMGSAGIVEANEVVADALADAEGSDRVGVVVVGDGALIGHPVANAADFDLTVLSDSGAGDSEDLSVGGDRTDLAAGLQLAGAILPEDSRRRVVVVSDGRVTTGDTAAAATTLAGSGIVVDYALIDSPIGTDAAVASLVAPPNVVEGSAVRAQVVVESTSAGPATITVERDGQLIESFGVELVGGATSFSFQDVPPGPGQFEYTATVDFEGDALPENDTARTVVNIGGDERVLLIEGSEGVSSLLEVALAGDEVAVDTVSVDAIPALETLAGYEVVVLADVGIPQLSDEHVQSLIVATRDRGVGLVTIGGPQAFGLGSYQGSALESILPVTSEIPPEREERVAQVLALDSSGSMAECDCPETTRFEDRISKLELARLGANQAIANLGPSDEVGVFTFDTGTQWIFQLGPASLQGEIERDFGFIFPSGGSSLSQILPTAANALRTSDADIKHVIVLTDGLSEQSDLELFEERARLLLEEDGITTSLVATGEGFEEALQVVADAGGGRFTAATDLSDIPNILAQESQAASRDFLQVGQFPPVISDVAEVVSSLDESPELTGYLVTTPKPTSRTLLRIGEENDALLTTWQVGLGRSTAWTSDAGAEWSEQWASWDGYATFWTGVVRDTFPVDDAGAVRATVEDGILTIRAETTPAQARLDATVSSPDGVVQPVALREIAPGVFEGSTEADDSGAYSVAVTSRGAEGASSVGSEIVSVSYSAEYRPSEANAAILDRVSEITGGRGAIAAADSFDPDSLNGARRPLRLTVPFLIAGLAAWLGAVALARIWFGRVRSSEGQKRTGRYATRLRRRSQPQREPAYQS